MTALDVFVFLLLLIVLGLVVAGSFEHDKNDAALDRIERKVDRLLGQGDEEDTP